MKVIISLVILMFLFVSCGDEKAELLNKIKDSENALFEKSQSLKPGETLAPELDQTLVDALLAYYHEFPEDELAPECLDKLHMKFSGSGDFEKAAMYGDTLLNNYKTYINRAMILESLANIYDMNVSPRDTAKVRMYNELLLKENPEMSAEKVEDIKYRLDNIDLTIGELIQKRISEQ